ncbi:hypothetical protein [Corynebacterium striatum]|uniref:hypothetical protein n=1 Tax=Corynebacterium striatum TaxID=43770 RepID=UPI00255180B7|nr:hypothetical protein [Corynebacterium striatum]MDK8806821.1 hypothetical protein [Corynebacterium striatum]
MPHEISLAEAITHLKEIEGRYQALYRYTRAPESIRRRLKDGAAHAHHVASLASAYERKTRNANPDHA